MLLFRYTYEIMHKEYKWLERGTLDFTLQQVANFVCILIHRNIPCSVIKLGEQLDISSFLHAFYVFICGCLLYLPEYKASFFPCIGIWKIVGYLTVMKKGNHTFVLKKIQCFSAVIIIISSTMRHHLFHMFVYVVGFISCVKYCAWFVLYMTL